MMIRPLYRRRVARNVALIGAAFGAVTRGVAYLPFGDYERTRLLSPVEGVMPVHWWGVVWIVVGVLCLASIWARRVSIAAMALFTTLLAMWASSYMWAWIDGESARGWVTGTLFALMALWAGVLTSLLERW